MATIDPDRVLADLRELARFGAYETGVHRPTFSPDDVAARHWFVGKLEEAGLEGVIDGIGSVFGLSRGDGPKVLTGSHLESQNHAGWLDGALGMVYGLEAARAIGRGVDVAGFCDEEGHFGSFIGSRSFTGLLEEEEIDGLRNRYDGRPLRDALAAAGLAGRPRMRVEPGRYRGFVEAHIEQGDTLESEALGIGVVSAIVAIWQYRIVAEGEQNHAGTTSMARRRDAGLAITRLLGEIDRRFPEFAGPRTVWTCGRVTFEPGAPSIIPGRAEALFQFRDTDPAVLDRLDGELRRLVEEANRGHCPVTLDMIGQSRPAKMNDRLCGLVAEAAEAHAPGGWTRMPSGAGHDAQYLARVMPAAMLFVPSIGGISHHWTENTSDEDIVLGARVYCDAIERILDEDAGEP
ncbi:Zn-dependent hydrolase [Enterovirga rhinocerotis]|uniref:N-carbamoyl-L-amino-acid hydrolase n=1 Tax=Enterovirga rhinocerotis TaxID=1339210 RepID=A0A4V3DWM9_9HYPH|nr:Zn-dependent hydrolase [Enterovirga rhinocerotis]TDR85429.1 N-carbamoyl-L-amino-acid hydrolase [Enterovirga rhinocerotis]